MGRDRGWEKKKRREGEKNGGMESREGGRDGWNMGGERKMEEKRNGERDIGRAGWKVGERRREGWKVEENVRTRDGRLKREMEGGMEGVRKEGRDRMGTREGGREGEK